MHKSKRKAFTLTELLVVVVIVGVLAAVALPKFSRAIETRKTGEAEEMLAAVRTEQEKRCTLDKPYAANFKSLGELVAGADGTSYEGNNYTYVLGPQGISASSSKGYSLEMPSYTDGRLCCSGDYCNRLNKSYPPCDTFTPETALCSAEAEVRECAGDATRTCGCNGAGTQSRTCDTSTGTWNAWGACSAAEECPCTDCSCAQYAASHGCECAPSQTTCCTSEQLAGGMWFSPDFGKCVCYSGFEWNSSSKRCECPVPNGELGLRYCTNPKKWNGWERRSWDPVNCQWSAWDDSECSCAGECTPGQQGGMGGWCGSNPDGTAIYGTKICNDECKWTNRCPGDPAPGGICGTSGKQPVPVKVASGAPTWIDVRPENCPRTSDNCGGNYSSCSDKLGFICTVDSYYLDSRNNCYYEQYMVRCVCP